MADSSLSREHSLALLQKLATDDGFRSRFEQKPAAALAELGVPHDTIVNLNAACLSSRTLADKDAFVDARQQLLNAGAEACIQMIIPNPKLNFGET